MLQLDLDKVLRNAQRADSLLLLDQVTVLREAMDPAALEVIETELAVRGVGPDEIAAHHRELKHRVLEGGKGMPAQCRLCGRAAVESRWERHRLLGLIPLFRQMGYYCDQHWAEKTA